MKEKISQFISKIGKKKLIIISSIVGAIIVLAAGVLTFLGVKYHIFCKHDWQAATCFEPETCSKCSYTRGVKLEHEFQPADCENPEICSLCNETRGNPLGHKWQDADCENPKTCTVCGKTEGSALDYEYIGEATVNIDSGTLKIRKSPDTNSDVVTEMSKGEKVDIYDCGDSDWYYVKYNEFYGYSSKSYGHL